MSTYASGHQKDAVPPPGYVNYSPGTPLNQNPPIVYGAYTPVRPVVVAHVVPPPISVVVVEDRRRRRGFFCTLLACVLLLAVAPKIVREMRHWHHRHWHWVAIYNDLPGDVEVPGDVKLQHCIEPAEWKDIEEDTQFGDIPMEFLNDVNIESLVSARRRRRSEAAFNLPLDSDSLFLLSMGRLSVGLVNITTSPDQTHDAATFRVIVHWQIEEVRDLARVCSVSRQEGENGVGIFTPQHGRWPDKEHRLFFQTLVTLPETEDAQVFVKKLETNVANTLHLLGDLGTKVSFDTLDLHGTNGLVVAESVAAREVKVRTSNSPIGGSFNATDSITLRSSNSRINVDVGLRTKGPDSVGLVDLKTSNSPLHARISLFSSESSGSAFQVSTLTSNSVLNVTFPAAPVDSKLEYKGRTSNSPAFVSLHPTYEGIFDVKSSLLSPSVAIREDIEDPAGEGRNRDVVVLKGPSRTQLHGWVHWGREEDPATLGSVEVSTSNSPVRLTV